MVHEHGEPAAPPAQLAQHTQLFFSKPAACASPAARLQVELLILPLPLALAIIVLIAYVSDFSEIDRELCM